MLSQDRRTQQWKFGLYSAVIASILADESRDYLQCNRELDQKKKNIIHLLLCCSCSVVSPSLAEQKALENPTPSSKWGFPLGILRFCWSWSRLIFQWQTLDCFTQHFHLPKPSSFPWSAAGSVAQFLSLYLVKVCEGRASWIHYV